jgi:TonB family protein
MRHICNALLIVSLSGFLSNFAQTPKPSPTSIAQEQTDKVADSDKVYSPKEVDAKAIIKNRNKLDPTGFSLDCPDEAILVLKVILHKSGKVSDVKVIKPISCSFEEKAIKSVRKAKFTPATKDGVAVSQYQLIEFRFHRF